LVYLVFSCDENRSFLQWLEIVRDHVFEVTKRGELPFGIIHEHLQAAGMHPPDVQCYFTMSRDHSDRHFGNIVISDETWRVGGMPTGLTVHIDERKTENCRISFDANVYDRGEMRLMRDRYLRLLELIGEQPEQPIGKLMMRMQWDAAVADVIAGTAWR
jgi:hypothetical protein